MSDATAAKVSCVAENSRPGELVVNVGSTRQSVASVDHSRKSRRRALGVEHRDTAAKRRDEEAEADDAVRGDHRRGEHGVARERAVSAPSGRHERDDQTDLDDGHGDGEDERPERLAHPVRHDLRVMDRSQHRAGEKGGDEGEDDIPGLASPRRGEGDKGDGRNGERPLHGTCDPHRSGNLRACSGARSR